MIHINRKENGPYEFKFDALTSMVNKAKSRINSNPLDAVRFDRKDRWNEGFRNIYFSQFTNRCGISRIHYGIDTMTPNKSHLLGKCDYTKHNHHLGKSNHIDLPSGMSFISYQEEYRDDTFSEILIFNLEFSIDIFISVFFLTDCFKNNLSLLLVFIVSSPLKS